MAIPSPIDIARTRRLSTGELGLFAHCAHAFRRTVIDGAPSPVSNGAAAERLVSRTLSALLALEPEERTPGRADRLVLQLGQDDVDDRHPDAAQTDAEVTELRRREAIVRSTAGRFLSNYFLIENPKTVAALELDRTVEVPGPGPTMTARLDRIERDERGRLQVSCYRTGSARTPRRPAGLDEVGLASLLCTHAVGQLPDRVQLLYLADPAVVVVEPTERDADRTRIRIEAMTKAIARAGEVDDFRPRPAPHCERCPHRAGCPAFEDRT